MLDLRRQSTQLFRLTAVTDGPSEFGVDVHHMTINIVCSKPQAGLLQDDSFLGDSDVQYR
jgi:hypothetical protein